jgi:hypothetical protein
MMASQRRLRPAHRPRGRVTVRGDVVRLLASLPDRGEISFRVTSRQGVQMAGRRRTSRN